MSTVHIDRLLDACIKMGGSDLHITVGRPPILRMHGRLRSLETKVLELSGQPTVELDKVVVSSGESPAAAKAVTPASGREGQVIVVNREYDFIVMNLGKNNGLEIGQQFQIVRGEEVLGWVKVEKVYDELAAAAILPQSKKEQIREGDVVKAL